MLQLPTSTVWSGVVVLREYFSLPMIISTAERCWTVFLGSRKQPQGLEYVFFSFYRLIYVYSRAHFQPLHPEDRAELCHDIVFRAIKATSHPRTFDQLTKCTHEWWDSNIHEPFSNLDQYLATRRVNIAMVSRTTWHVWLACLSDVSLLVFRKW